MRAWGLKLGLLRERLYRLVMDRIKPRQANRKTQTSKSGKRRPKGNIEMERDWLVSIGHYLTELYAVRDAIKSISSIYLGGNQLLLADYTILLDAIIDETEKLTKISNDVLSYGRGKTLHTDLKSILDQSHKEMERQMTNIVYMAKSEALSLMGDDEGAQVLAEQLVDMETKSPTYVPHAGVPF